MLKRLCCSCVFAAIALAVSPPAYAQAVLAWDEDPSMTSEISGYAVTIDGGRIDYGLMPAGRNGTCGCSIPLPFSGGYHTITVSAYGRNVEAESSALRVGPSATAGGPYAGSVGTPIAFDGSRSASSGGSIIGFEWNWGDGTGSTGASSATHAYGAAGTFTVTLTVTDNAGAKASSSAVVTIAAPSRGNPGRRRSR